MMIDRESGIPYYVQVREAICKQIADGVLQEGQQLPSEIEMSTIFRINRHTVRQAVDELCRFGKLYKIRGRGTFVAKASLDTIAYELSANNRFSENARKMGATPGTKVLQASEIAAPEDVQKALHLECHERVYFLHIQRFINTRPFLIGQDFLPVKYFPNALPSLGTVQSLSKFYAEYNIQYERMKSNIRAVFPTKEEALLLGVPESMPVLKVKKLTRSQTGTVIEYGVSCYRGDFTELSINW